MKYSLSSKVIFPWGGADGELGDAARITLPRIDLGADGKMGDSTGITLPGIHFGIGGKMGVSGRNTSPKRGITTHEELKQCS